MRYTRRPRASRTALEEGSFRGKGYAVLGVRGCADRSVSSPSRVQRWLLSRERYFSRARRITQWDQGDGQGARAVVLPPPA